MWKNTDEVFEQVPRVGEYIAPGSTSGWYKVTLVVWLPNSAKTEYLVEVYAVAFDHLAAHRLVHGDEMLSEMGWPAGDPSPGHDES